jgi:hypothetical protein
MSPGNAARLGLAVRLEFLRATPRICLWPSVVTGRVGGETFALDYDTVGNINNYNMRVPLFLGTKQYVWHPHAPPAECTRCLTAQGISNPVARIASGEAPWTTTIGAAAVDLNNGEAAFFVKGLVLVGATRAARQVP